MTEPGTRAASAASRSATRHGQLRRVASSAAPIAVRVRLTDPSRESSPAATTRALAIGTSPIAASTPKAIGKS
jgi:hypothetical protein